MCDIYGFFSFTNGGLPSKQLLICAIDSILPALAFSLDMFQNTGSNYGVNEVLLASVLGSVVFSIFSAQPLVIVGVTGKCAIYYPYKLHGISLVLTWHSTGPITVFNSTVYDIMKPTGVNYLGFMAWIGL